LDTSKFSASDDYDYDSQPYFKEKPEKSILKEAEAKDLWALDFRSQCYKTFYGYNLLIFLIS
jgi:hypothetical protein